MPFHKRRRWSCLPQRRTVVLPLTVRLPANVTGSDGLAGIGSYARCACKPYALYVTLPGELSAFLSKGSLLGLLGRDPNHCGFRKPGRLPLLPRCVCAPLSRSTTPHMPRLDARGRRPDPAQRRCAVRRHRPAHPHRQDPVGPQEPRDPAAAPGGHQAHPDAVPGRARGAPESARRC